LLKDLWKAEAKTPSQGAPHKGSGGAAATRTSNGLDQFFASLNDRENLNILDLAGASQANISFITNLGHRIYSDDILHTLDDAFGSNAEFVENQGDRGRIEQFLRQSLDFPEGHFDGALVWDTLQFLSPLLLQETVDRLFHILRPQASLLAFFNAEEKLNTIPVSSYRIADSKTLLLLPRGERKPTQFFNNRTLEKLFQNFYTVKFFLTRDHLREVIVRR
jgi:hypothetical protein